MTTQIETRRVKSDKPRIAWLFSDWQQNAYRQENDLYGGIGYYRVIKPAQVLRQWYDIDVIGADIRRWGTTDETYTRLGRDYDLIISKHALTGQNASHTLATAKYYKRKVLVDIDDNYFALRKDNPAHADYQYGQGPREFIGAFMSLADGVIVSTKPLKDVYAPLNKQRFILPNCCDINDWPNVRKRWDDGKVRIGFAGGQGHDADLDLILEPLSYILAKYPNVLFQIMGAITPERAMIMGSKMNNYCKKDVTPQFQMTPATLAWQGYPDVLSSFGWDIVLAPLVDDPFNRSKSHIRWLEASMIHAPVVASPVYPYVADINKTQTIQHGKTGFVAKTSEEWFNTLETLVLKKDLRIQVADNAYDYIKDHWQYSQWANKWKKVIDKYI